MNNETKQLYKKASIIIISLSNGESKPLKSLAKNSVYNIIYTTANIIFPLISSMYVSRVLMADGVGKVAYAQNLASYFVILAALGTPVYGIRKIAAYQNDRQKTNQFFTQLFVINAISTVISSVVYVIFIFAIKVLKVSQSYICVRDFNCFSIFSTLIGFTKARKNTAILRCEVY